MSFSVPHAADHLAKRYLYRPAADSQAYTPADAPGAIFASRLQLLPDFWDGALTVEDQASRIQDVLTRQLAFARSLGDFTADATFELRLVTQPDDRERVQFIFLGSVEDEQRAPDAWRLFHANFPADRDFRLEMLPQDQVASCCNPLGVNARYFYQWIPQADYIAIVDAPRFPYFQMPVPSLDSKLSVVRLLAQQAQPLVLGFAVQPLAYDHPHVRTTRDTWLSRLGVIDTLLALMNTAGGWDELSRRFDDLIEHGLLGDWFGALAGSDPIWNSVGSAMARDELARRFSATPSYRLEQARAAALRLLNSTTFYHWRVHAVAEQPLPDEIKHSVTSDLGQASGSGGVTRYVCTSINGYSETAPNYHHVRLLQSRIALDDQGNYTPHGDIVDADAAAALLHIPIVPRGGIPGVPSYPANPFSSWQLDEPGEAAATTITLGDFVDSRTALLNTRGQQFAVSLQDLTRHALVTGSTGAGKSTTCKRLLLELHEQHVPFLVIEPVKDEYADLALAPRAPLLRGRHYLDFHRLGDPAGTLWFNPFYIRKGISLNTHLSYLQSCFFAAFPMSDWFAMVFAGALHRAYAKKAADRWPGQPVPYKGTQPVRAKLTDTDFPNLNDLHTAMEEELKHRGYTGEIAKNLEAALTLRIESLQRGLVGQLLTPKKTASFEARLEDLLRRPTVVQLSLIADKSEKSLIMAFLLTALYEYYEQQPTTDDLRHVTLLEEAHVLLENVPRQQQEGSTNTRGKAIDLFADMLAELRSRGEGLIIAEQLPSKIIPEAIKNTNLKIMHRLTARDDREVLGAAMNFSEQQSRFATTLL